MSATATELNFTASGVSPAEITVPVTVKSGTGSASLTVDASSEAGTIKVTWKDTLDASGLSLAEDVSQVAFLITIGTDATTPDQEEQDNVIVLSRGASATLFSIEQAFLSAVSFSFMSVPSSAGSVVIDCGTGSATSTLTFLLQQS